MESTAYHRRAMLVEDDAFTRALMREVISGGSELFDAVTCGWALEAGEGGSILVATMALDGAAVS